PRPQPAAGRRHGLRREVRAGRRGGRGQCGRTGGGPRAGGLFQRRRPAHHGPAEPGNRAIAGVSWTRRSGAPGRPGAAHGDRRGIVGSGRLMNMQAVAEKGFDLEATMLAIGRAAAASRAALALSDGETRNRALLAAARAIRARTADILAANAEDMRVAKAHGLSAAMLDRLLLNDKRIESMAAGIEQIAALPDPIGAIAAEWTRPNGLRIQRVRVP